MSGRSPRAPAERATSNVTPSAEPAELEPGKLYAIHLPGRALAAREPNSQR
jgi:hypothetical protein